jgi:hypothetical protein
MSQAFGYNAFLGWKEQVSFDTAASPPNKWLFAEAFPAPEADRKPIHKPYLGTVSRQSTIREKHAPAMTGIKFPVIQEGIEQLLKHALGGVVTTGPSGSIYTHTFSLASALPAAGLTVDLDVDDGAITGDHVQRIIGAQIDKLVLTQEVGGTLDAEIDLVGREYVDVARTSPTLPTFNPYDYAMMTVSALNPGGTNFALPIRMWKLEVNNNLFKDAYRLTGAGKRSAFGRASQRTVSMEFEIEYESDTVTNYFKSGSFTDVEFKWVNGSNEIAITSPNGIFSGSRPGAENAGPVYLKMQFDALRTSSDNNELTVVMKNTLSSV